MDFERLSVGLASKLRFVISIFISFVPFLGFAGEQNCQESQVTIAAQNDDQADALKAAQLEENAPGKFCISHETLEKLRERGLIGADMVSSGGTDTTGGF